MTARTGAILGRADVLERGDERMHLLQQRGGYAAASYAPSTYGRRLLALRRRLISGRDRAREAAPGAERLENVVRGAEREPPRHS